MTKSPKDFERRIGFVKISKAVHAITLHAGHADVVSAIDFELKNDEDTDDARCPILDLGHPEHVKRLRLNGEDVSWLRTASPDPRQSARFTILDKRVHPGKRHHAVFNHELRLGRDDAGEDNSVLFFRMSHAKHFLLEGRDRDRDRLFLERYLPANFEFDQHEVVLDVSVPRAWGLVLFTNGRPELPDGRPAIDGAFRLQGDKFRVRFPDSFTCSSPFFFLGRRSRIQHGWIAQPDGADWPPGGVVLFGSRQRMRLEGQEIADIVRRELPKIIGDLGPYPHEDGPLLLLASRYGTEYVNAAEVSAGNVFHELLHMYWGRCVMPRDGNAGWIDEAVAHWFESGCQQYPAPPDPDDPVKLAGGSPYQRATFHASRTTGPMVLGHLDWHFQRGDRPGLKTFLCDYAQHNRMSVISSKKFRRALIAARPPEDHALITEVFHRYIDP